MHNVWQTKCTVRVAPRTTRVAIIYAMTSHRRATALPSHNISDFLLAPLFPHPKTMISHSSNDKPSCRNRVAQSPRHLAALPYRTGCPYAWWYLVSSPTKCACSCRSLSSNSGPSSRTSRDNMLPESANRFAGVPSSATDPASMTTTRWQ